MAAKPKYSATTRHISVTVSPTYLDDQSVPENSHFVWAYRVLIENRGPDTVQLRSRHWRITNARGEVSEVRGPGVVGEQPRLEPGDEFEYTSAVPLTTPSGIMTGSYQMEDGHRRKLRCRDPRLLPGQPPSARDAQLK